MEETIDWKSLEFTCVTEKNPPLDKEADHWFQSARAIEKGRKPGTDKQMVELYGHLKQSSRTVCVTTQHVGFYIHHFHLSLLSKNVGDSPCRGVPDRVELT